MILNNIPPCVPHASLPRVDGYLPISQNPLVFNPYSLRTLLDIASLQEYAQRDTKGIHTAIQRIHELQRSIPLIPPTEVSCEGMPVLDCVDIIQSVPLGVIQYIMRYLSTCSALNMQPSVENLNKYPAKQQIGILQPLLAQIKALQQSWHANISLLVYKSGLATNMHEIIHRSPNAWSMNHNTHHVLTSQEHIPTQVSQVLQEFQTIITHIETYLSWIHTAIMYDVTVDSHVSAHMLLSECDIHIDSALMLIGILVPWYISPLVQKCIDGFHMEKSVLWSSEKAIQDMLSMLSEHEQCIRHAYHTAINASPTSRHTLPAFIS